MHLLPIFKASMPDVPEPKNKIWDYLYSADKILYNVKKKSRNDFGMGECELMEH